MLKYTLKRSLTAVIVFLLVTVIMFLFFHFASPPPINIELFVPDPGEIERLRHELGLDRPLIIQYFNFLKGIFTGDLGESVLRMEPVKGLIDQHLPITLYYCFTTLLLGSVLGAYLLALSTMKRRKWADSLFKYLSSLLISIPVFIPAILVIFALLQLSGPPWPSKGYTPPEFIVFAVKWIFPVLLLVIVDLAYILFYGRFRMHEVEERTKLKAVFSSNLLDMIKTSQAHLGLIINLCIFIEIVFGMPGILRLLFDGIRSYDYYVAQGVLVVISVIMILLSFFSDVIYQHFTTKKLVPAFKAAG
jgi:ABC-type dipeptide/oligopeptide/nickel transport system permease component